MKLLNHFLNNIPTVCLAFLYTLEAMAADNIPKFNTALEIKRLDKEISERCLVVKFDIDNDSAKWHMIQSSSEFACHNLYINQNSKYGYFLLGMMTCKGDAPINEIKPDSEIVKVKVRNGVVNYRTVKANLKKKGSIPSKEIKDLDKNEEIVINVFEDADLDGLIDKDEYYIYKSWPGNYDSDGDGVGDGDEYEKLKTAPMLYDTDGDGIGDKEDSEPLKPSMLASFKAWSEHWKSVLMTVSPNATNFSSLDSQTGDYDGDGKSNYQEFKKGTSPIWGPEVHDVVFSRPYLLSSSKTNATYAFSMTICSEEAVEGLLCCPWSKIQPFYSQTRYQYLPDAVLPNPGENCESKMFLARYGVPLEWRITLPATDSKFTFEDMYVMTKNGIMPSMLRICSSRDYANESTTIPQIAYPKPGQIVESDFVNFVWECDNSAARQYCLSIISSNGDRQNNTCYSTQLQVPFVKTDNYFCQVSAYDLKKKFLGSSPIVPFTLLHSSGNSDSDGDGFTDNNEFINGSDSASAMDNPLRADQNNATIQAKVGQHLNYRLNALGGSRPLRWITGDSLPEGLRLESSGSIEGTPVSSGNYDITVMAVDVKNHRITKKLTITISGASNTVIKPGRGAAGERP